jgi:hypothetical protein
MKRTPLIAFLLVPGLAVGLQEKKPQKPVEIKTIMVKRGELLFEDSFAGEAIDKEWNRYKGNYAVEKGQLKVAEIPSDGHHPAMSRKADTTNCVVQFSFKFEGSTWMGFAWDEKEHVARVILRPDSVQLLKMSGTGPTTKSEKVDEKRLKFEPGTLHTLLVEIQGKEMLAQVDGKDILYGEAPGVDGTKSRVELISGGQWAWYDDIKVWKAEPEDKWPQKRKILLAQMKK